MGQCPGQEVGGVTVRCVEDMWAVTVTFEGGLPDELIDRLVWHHDGPFGDSSAIPTYLLSELTRANVTVALNGDGGDEVFAGYLRLYGGALSERFPRWAFGLAAAGAADSAVAGALDCDAGSHAASNNAAGKRVTHAVIFI